MLWWPGERERAEAWMVSRASRMRYRADLERAMAVTDSSPYIALQENFAALVADAHQRHRLPEPEFPDSRVIVNSNLW